MTSIPIKVRKIPCIVTAVEYDGTDESAKACGLTLQELASGPLGRRNFAWGVRTLEGFMQASKGDWIITGVEGERYPCKASVFAKTYERVSQTEKEKFMEWFKREQARGLIDFKFTPSWFPGPAPADVDEEAVYLALNAANAAFARGDAKPLTDI